jgi:hypothetical protein
MSPLSRAAQSLSQQKDGRGSSLDRFPQKTSMAKSGAQMTFSSNSLQIPCFQDALICIAPHWQGNPLNNDKVVSTVLAAIIDDDNSMCQNALTHGVRMFGAQVKFLRCGDNPSLLAMLQMPSIGTLRQLVEMQAPQRTRSSAIGAAAHMMDANMTMNAMQKHTRRSANATASSSVCSARRRTIMQITQMPQEG